MQGFPYFCMYFSSQWNLWCCHSHPSHVRSILFLTCDFNCCYMACGPIFFCFLFICINSSNSSVYIVFIDIHPAPSFLRIEEQVTFVFFIFHIRSILSEITCAFFVIEPADKRNYRVCAIGISADYPNRKSSSRHNLA